MSRTDAGDEEGGVFFEEDLVAGEGADKVLAGKGREGCCDADVCVLFEKGEYWGEGNDLEESGI